MAEFDAEWLVFNQMMLPSEEEIEFIAKAMASRREELIAQPLAQIWKELAIAAVAAEERFTQSKIDTH